MRSIRRMLLPAAAALVVGFSTSCTVSNSPCSGLEAVRTRLASSETPAVLFIGNSYTFGLPKAFARAAKSGGREVEVAQATRSGQSLARHANDPVTLQTLRSRRWDVVVLQESSRTPADPVKRRLSMIPAIKKLARETRRQGSLPVLYQTWGRRDGDRRFPGDDFFRMNRRIREGYVLASRKCGNLPIVPVGEAWEREFRAGRGAELYQPDGSHPSADGVRLTAETFRMALLPVSADAATEKGGHEVRP